MGEIFKFPSGKKITPEELLEKIAPEEAEVSAVGLEKNHPTRLERFIENYPKSFSDNFKWWLKQFEKGEITREEVLRRSQDQIEPALNSIEALQGKYNRKE